MATIDQRGKYWRARVGGKGFTRRSKSFDTYREAKDWADRIESVRSGGTDPLAHVDNEPIIGDLLKRYRDEITPNKKSAVQETRRIDAWLAHPIARLKPSQLLPSHIKGFMSDRRAGRIAFAPLTSSRNAKKRPGKRNGAPKPVQDATIRLDLAILSHLYTVCKKEWDMEYLVDPFENVTMPEASDERDRRLDEDEMRRFIEALADCRNPFMPLVVAFAIETAMRQGEILKLMKYRVNTVLRVAVVKDTKNGTDLGTPLSNRALAILDDVPEHTSPKVFPITRNQIACAWQRLMKRANIEDFSFRDLRHEATSRLFERGLQIMEVQKFTNHKTLKMLLRYTHLNPAVVLQRLDATNEIADKIHPQVLRTSVDPAEAGAMSSAPIPSDEANGTMAFPGRWEWVDDLSS